MSDRNNQNPNASSQVRRTPRPQQNSAARPAVRRKADPKTPYDFASKALKTIGAVLQTVWKVLCKGLSKFNHLFDVFRTNEVTTVLVNALLGGVVVVIALCILMACKPGIDSMRARSAAASGDVRQAVSLVRSLERNGYPQDKLDATRIAVVGGFIDAGEFDEALTMLPNIDDEAARAELDRRCSYARAAAEYEAGRYSEAAQRFYQLESYKDSQSRYSDCRCALAIEAYLAGNESSARSLLLDLTDAVARVEKAVAKVADSEEEAQRILTSDLFSADALSRMEATMTGLKEARSEMPKGRVAAGKQHTVGLRSDGTVVAAGDNSMGQCNVSSWTNVVQVVAGSYHTVGLRSDGTCVAVGDNSAGQSEVSGWTDIVAIAAANYDTIGLKSDGTVVICGAHAAKVSGWHDVTFVAAGGYSLGCLYGNGMMMSSHRGAQMDMGVVLYDLSVCGQVSVGILYDGTMVSSFDGAPDWTGMVSATACETGILGIDVDGQVRSFFYREGSATDVSVPGTAVEVESGGMHHVVLMEDGRVYAFGNNEYGQCNVSDWQL